jgi:hypothetical protein
MLKEFKEKKAAAAITVFLQSKNEHCKKTRRGQSIIHRFLLFVGRGVLEPNPSEKWVTAVVLRMGVCVVCSIKCTVLFGLLYFQMNICILR